MTESFGFIADVHANDIALKIALEQLDQQGVNEIICAGDIMGYGGCPNETISLLRKYKVNCILGNHDFFFLANLTQENKADHFVFLPDFLDKASDMKFREIAQIMLEYQKKVISERNVKWLGTLPISLFTDNDRIFSIHGAPPADTNFRAIVEGDHLIYALNKYLFPWDNDNLSLSCKLQPADTMVIGHTHMQFAHQSKDPNQSPYKTAHPCLMNYDLFPIKKTFEKSYPLLINPGSVGQSRDEINAPGYAILTYQGSSKRVVKWVRYKYDFEAYVDRMKSKEAPEEIFDRNFWHVDF